MGWFKKKPFRPPETLWVPSLSFLGEQDGPPERELKAQFCQLLQNRACVQHAYLARVDYGNPGEYHVALCLRMTISDDAKLKKAIGEVFAQKFGRHEHLDVIFVREDQEDDLSKVCRPFYVAT
jgi:hypothetical protein